MNWGKGIDGCGWGGGGTGVGSTSWSTLHGVFQNAFIAIKLM